MSESRRIANRKAQQRFRENQKKMFQDLEESFQKASDTIQRLETEHESLNLQLNESRQPIELSAAGCITAGRTSQGSPSEEFTSTRSVRDSSTDDGKWDLPMVQYNQDCNDLSSQWFRDLGPSNGTNGGVTCHTDSLAGADPSWSTSLTTELAAPETIPAQQEDLNTFPLMFPMTSANDPFFTNGCGQNFSPWHTGTQNTYYMHQNLAPQLPYQQVSPGSIPALTVVEKCIDLLQLLIHNSIYNMQTAESSNYPTSTRNYPP